MIIVQIINEFVFLLYVDQKFVCGLEILLDAAYTIELDEYVRITNAGIFSSKIANQYFFNLRFAN